MNRYTIRRWFMRWFSWVACATMAVQCVSLLNRDEHVHAVVSAFMAGVFVSAILNNRRIRLWRQISHTWRRINVMRVVLYNRQRATLDKLAGIRFSEATANKPIGARNASRGQA